MEAITSALSVVTTAYTVIDFFASVASADEDCKELVRELYTTVRIIDYIRLLAKENAEKLKRLNSLLVPNGALDQFRHTVDDLSSRILQAKASIKEGYKRVKFVLRQKTIQELLQSIQRQKIMFMDCSGIENTDMLLQLTADVNVLLSKMQELTVQVSSSEDSRQRGLPSEVKHPFLVPFSQDTHSLVVRDAYRIAIESKFKTCTRVTLYGLGGSGKSRLAIEFAYRHKDYRPVFWIYAGSEALFRSSYGKIAQTVPAHFRRNFEERDATESIGHSKDIVSFNIRLAKAWLEDDESGDWVLILDNIDNPAMIQRQGNDAASIEQLPIRSRGKVLATSRRKDLALGMAGSENSVIHVDVFAPDEAVVCFKQLLPTDDTSDDDILSLSKYLGFLPLAIRQAAAYVSNQSASIMEYSDYLTSGEDSQLLLLEQEFRDNMRADDVPNSVLRTWLMSFEQLRQQNEEAARVLCFMAALDRSEVQDFILKEMWKDPIRFRANIGLVISFSFVGVVGPRRNSYTMHRIVQLSTHAWIETRGEKQLIESMALSTILRLFADAMEAFRWSECQILLPHARCLVDMKIEDAELALKRESLLGLVEAFEDRPLWQLSSQYNLEVYERLSADKDLVDITSALVAQEAFRQWLHGTHSLVHVQGLPGRGKTVACFYMVKFLKSWFNLNGSRPIVTYFFLDFTQIITIIDETDSDDIDSDEDDSDQDDSDEDDSEETGSEEIDSTKILLLNIISQVYQQIDSTNLPERVRMILSLTDEYPSRVDLMEAVRDLSNATDQRIFVILDGLDNLYVISGKKVTETIQIILHLMENCPTLSIMVSYGGSTDFERLEESINYQLNKLNAPTILLDEISPALDIYLSKRLHRLGIPENENLCIRQGIMKRASGDFEFARLLMRYTIASAPSVDGIFESVEELPYDYFDLLERIFGNIDPAHIKHVLLVLNWVGFAREPLTERQLSSILDLKCRDYPSSTIFEIIRMTKGLLYTQDVTSESEDTQSIEPVVTLTNSLGTLTFRYLVTDGEFRIHDIDEIHRNMLDVCLEILLDNGEEQCPKTEQHPLLHYAAKFWLDHLNALEFKFLSYKTDSCLRRLFNPEAPNAFLRWVRIYDPAEPDLGAQPMKRLADFQPMGFYIDILELHDFLTGGPWNLPREQDQRSISSSYYNSQWSSTDSHTDSRVGEGEGEGEGEEDKTDSPNPQPFVAESQGNVGEEQERRDLSGSRHLPSPESGVHEN